MGARYWQYEAFASKQEFPRRAHHAQGIVDLLKCLNDLRFILFSSTKVCWKRRATRKHSEKKMEQKKFPVKMAGIAQRHTGTHP
jgi:hypothetical protein